MRTETLQKTLAKGLSRARGIGFKTSANNQGVEKRCRGAKISTKQIEVLHKSHPLWALPKQPKSCVNKVTRYTDVWFLLSSLENNEFTTEEYSHQRELENIEVVSSMLKNAHLCG
jgi:hypothetical protein